MLIDENNDLLSSTSALICVACETHSLPLVHFDIFIHRCDLSPRHYL